MPAFRLLFNTPRAYGPLALAWEGHYPGTLRALRRLVGSGFVEYQPALLVDTRTGKVAQQATRPVARYVVTAAGRRLLAEAAEDLRLFEDAFPQLTAANVRGVAALLKAFDVSGSNARLGISASHAASATRLAERTARWWVAQFARRRLIRRLPVELADVREIVPEHWRVTRLLCQQLADVLENVDGAPSHLLREFRLRRERFAGPLAPARIGVAGATDFDHDVTSQTILAAFLASPNAAPEGIFAVEPRIQLPLDTSDVPWRFTLGASDALYYQPDAELRERSDGGARRSVLEYERYQTRRDAWGHIERFLGMMHTTSFGVEPAILRFVVDTPGRVRGYVELIEAFCDYVSENPERLPRNPLTLAVAGLDAVLEAEDGLDLSSWFRIELPSDEAGGVREVVLHPPDGSPYREYF